MMGLLVISALMAVVVTFFQATVCNPDAKRLYDDLLSNYNRLIRPVANDSEKVTVKLGLRLSQLIDLNLKDQILTTNVWVEHEWMDPKFTWDPLEYGGLKTLYVPSTKIWRPDLLLYNTADGEYVVTTMTKAVLTFNGSVSWRPPAIFKSYCEINVRYFPFDQQECFMKFGSWTYGLQIDLKHKDAIEGKAEVEVGIDLTEYYRSVEWDILKVPAKRNEKFYPCCAEPFPDIFFNMTLRRKTLFYTVNLIFPCVAISNLSVLVFYLPADSGEKVALCISILLSQTMFFLLISEIIPSTSLAVPLLGRYLLFTMFLVGLSILITIIILNIHYRKPSTHKMAPWVRRVFIHMLPKILLMRVPTPAEKPEDKKEPIAEWSSLSGSSLLDPVSAVYSGIQLPPPPPPPPGCFVQECGDQPLPTISDGSEAITADIQRAIVSVRFIHNHILAQNAYDKEDEDWGFVAMVLDRLFLWIFSLVSIIGTVSILCDAPSLYDNTMPIDIEYSRITQSQLMTDHEI